MTLLRAFHVCLMLGAAALSALELPDIPDPHGRAGMMAAVILDGDGREAILAAGGANFPGKPPWEGGTKVFHRDIFLCRRGADDRWTWRKVGELPAPNAYAAFCAGLDRKALIIAGGADADKHLDAVWKVTADGRCEKFAAPLPEPRAYAGFAEVNGALAVLDNTQAGFHQHGEYPVDIFVHSLTKFATGVGDVMGGAVIADHAVMAKIRPDMLLFGAPLDPLAASLMVRGLKTYFLRYREQSAAATEIALFLESHPACSRVMHPGLGSHPQAALARAQMRDPGCVITFSLQGGIEVGRRFADALRLFARTPSYGSTESLVMAPQMLQPRDFSPEERAVCGIDEGSVRLSIGLEDLGELRADLAQALAQAAVTSRP